MFVKGGALLLGEYMPSRLFSGRYFLQPRASMFCCWNINHRGNKIFSAPRCEKVCLHTLKNIFTRGGGALPLKPLGSFWGEKNILPCVKTSVKRPFPLLLKRGGTPPEGNIGLKNPLWTFFGRGAPNSSIGESFPKEPY